MPAGVQTARSCGAILYILRGLKDMIVTGGENIYSGEMEAVLSTYPAIREAAVFGIPDLGSSGTGRELSASPASHSRGAHTMAENVYKVIELIGTSTESWEKAAAAAVNRASKSLRDLRVAEVVELDMQLNNGKVEAYRAKVKVSFKYEAGSKK
jgi:dodecin